MSHRRIVVKVGSSSLTDAGGQLAPDRIQVLVDNIAELRDRDGCQVILVTSGAVAAGVSHLRWQRATVTVPEKQAAAAVGQGLLIDTYQRLFADLDIPIAQLLLTRSDIEDRKRFIHIRNTTETLLFHHIIPIINENDTVAVDEIRFGDNDTLASLVALVTEADLLILLTDIDGLYTDNPRLNNDAKRISDVWEITDEMEGMAGGHGSSVGTGGMRTKLAAARIATQSGIDVVIASSNVEHVLHKIVDSHSVGTHFHARKDSLRGKRSWMIHGTRVEGQLIIDDGAVTALSEHSGSLLLPGVVDVIGDFHEGAIVEMMSLQGSSIAKGAVNFAASDLRILLDRRKSGERVSNVDEVVHRNEMAITLERSRS